MPINVGTVDPALESQEINSLINDRRDIDFSQQILTLEPDAAPLTAILGQIGSKPTQDVEFRWFEEDPLNRVLSLTTGFDDNATSITVSDTSGIHPNDVIRATLNTGGGLLEELLRVVSVDSATDITVTRAYSGSAEDFSGADASNPLQLTVLGNVAGEGTGAPADRKTAQPNVLRNIVAITKTPFSVSGTVDRTKQRANPQERARLQRYWGVEHRKTLEYLALFGDLVEDFTEGEHPTRVSKGITQFINTHLKDLGGNVTLSGLYEIAEEIFSYGDNNERWVFSGPTFLTKLSNLGTNQIRIEPGEKEYGVSFNRVITPHGELKVVRHRMLRGPVWGRSAIILDLSTVQGEPLVQVRHTNGGQTRLSLNIQNNDEDIVRDQFFTEQGYALRQEKRHGILFNA